MKETETEIEKRAFRGEVRVVEADGQPTKIVGMAVPYNALSEPLWGFRERFSEGAFRESITKGVKGVINVEHNETVKLARFNGTSNRVWDDPRGVFVEITPAKTRAGQDAIEEVRTGILDAMSVEFRTSKEDTDLASDGEDVVRTVKRAELVGLALTSFPAYPQTAGTLALRSLEEFRKAEEERKAAEAAVAPSPPEPAAWPDPAAELDILRRRIELAEME